MEYAIRVGFKAINNEAEYKALLTELRVAIELGVEFLDIFRFQEDYLANDLRMMAYLV